MTSRKQGARGDSPAAHRYDDDGPASRDLFRKPSRTKNDHKTGQLCRQVFETLACTLPGLGDPWLQRLGVERVTPAPNASRLLVEVRSDDASVTGDELLQRLARATPMLRAELAAAISRKRVPEIVFHFVREEVRGE